jgi:hypothetical protein
LVLRLKRLANAPRSSRFGTGIIFLGIILPAEKVPDLLDFPDLTRK